MLDPTLTRAEREIRYELCQFEYKGGGGHKFGKPTIADLSAKYGLSQSSLSRRLRDGVVGIKNPKKGPYSVEEAASIQAQLDAGEITDIVAKNHNRRVESICRRFRVTNAKRPGRPRRVEAPRPSPPPPAEATIASMRAEIVSLRMQVTALQSEVDRLRLYTTPESEVTTGG